VLRSLLAAFILAALLADPARAESSCDPNRIDILAGKDRHRFSIEIADDPAEQARGLMFRPTLAADAGMLFIFDPPRPAHFWMRNTMIPLDMIFIDDAGRVESIAERPDTFSDRVSSSRGPVRAVLEVNGGVSRLLGISPGAQAVHPAFREAPEALRCAE
jgi:uncharacterized membrane protein (UPF0127 family)